MKDTEIRQGQAIFPWGVGSIVPLPNDLSAVVMGLHHWDNDGRFFTLSDSRLCRFLGIDQLRLPPSYEINSQNPKIENKYIPLGLFPNWYYCQQCGKMQFIPQNNEPQACPDHTKLRLVPERFVIACNNGHLDNLPILQLIHGANFNVDLWISDAAFRAQHTIRRMTDNKTGISTIGYKCSCESIETPKHRVSEMMSPEGFQKFLPKCRGRKPWLSETYYEECSCGCGEMKAVQKGGSNVWFPSIYSSIYIPPSFYEIDYGPYEDAIAQFYPLSAPTEEQKNDFLTKLAEIHKLDPKIMIDAYNRLSNSTSGPEKQTDSEYRFEEYSFLTRTCGSDSEDLYVQTLDVSEYDPILSEFISKISLVKKMKETRVLTGFGRLTPPNIGFTPDFPNLTIQDQSDKKWLPANQTRGEGVMIEFNKKAVLEWSNNPKIAARVKLLNDRASAPGIPSALKKDDLNAAELMVHTISHLLINQISKDSGYGSSSIRERIYVSNEESREMLGVLLYTSSAGSEGSWGGLVRQGKHGYFEKALYKAVLNARWCSADPICINSKGQGPDSCNLAACHNCALLPETCCENSNRFLDRAMIVGTLEDRSIGFFSGLSII